MSYQLGTLLYPPGKFQIFLTDPDDLLAVYKPRRLPGRPIRYNLGEYELRMGTRFQVDFCINPKQLFARREFVLDVFYEGKRYRQGLPIVFAEPEVVDAMTDQPEGSA